MLPVCLQVTLHNEDIAVAEAIVQLVAPVSFQPELKVSGLAQADGTDWSILAVQLLIVRVPSHVVLSITVQIKQAAVECCTNQLFCNLLRLQATRLSGTVREHEC